MNNPCNQIDKITAIKEDVGEIKVDLSEVKRDIKDLVSFQSKILGAIAATFSISTLFGFIIGIIINIYLSKD